MGNRRQSTGLQNELKRRYVQLYASLPSGLAGWWSDVVFHLRKRPLVYVDKEQHPAGGLAKGVVTFSIDFEMAWAYQCSKSLKEDPIALGLRERAQVPLILAAFNEYDIPATWATVGHLFLDHCLRGSTGLAHEEIARCEHFENDYWRFSSGDWFQHDPCTDVRKDPAWYAPDLIKAIVASKTKHEIACHSFSHVGFGSYCPPRACEAELDACIEVMKGYNLQPVSMVFPGNEEGHFDILARKGFTAVRAFPVPWADISLPLKGRNGVWQVHSSSVIETEFEGADLERRFQRLKKFVDKAAETRLAAHFWFHPSLPVRQMHGLLFPFLRYCAKLRDKGYIDCMTMTSLVSATEEQRGRSGNGETKR